MNTGEYIRNTLLYNPHAKREKAGNTISNKKEFNIDIELMKFAVYTYTMLSVFCKKNLKLEEYHNVLRTAENWFKDNEIDLKGNTTKE